MSEKIERRPFLAFVLVAIVVGCVAIWSNETTFAAQERACIDINTASGRELERIIHIGPDRAAQIIALRKERPFRTVYELVRVKGIAEARLADIKREGL